MPYTTAAASPSQPAPPAPGAPPLTPIATGERIDAMDIARGFALLGILSVNITAFAYPIGRLFEQSVPVGEGALGAAWHWLVHALFMGKSYPLFCTLFGMGLTIQQLRAAQRGGSAAWLQTRRLAILAFIGLCHIVFLWYGDILLTYAIIGLAVFWALRRSVRVLLPVAIALMLFGSLLAGTFMVLSGPPPAAAGAHSPATWVAPAPGTALDGGTPVQHVWKRMQSQSDTDPFQGPADKAWMDAETIASRDGPYLAAMSMRGMNYAGYCMFLIFGGWQMVGLMLLGSVLVRTQFLSPAHRSWQVAAVVGALFLGIPAAVAASLLHEHPSGLVRGGLGALGMLFAPLVSLGYLSAAALVANAGLLRPLTRLLAAAGRMALTNYLTHTLVCSLIFQHWGLGEFASWSLPQMAALVLGIYAVQLPLSALWLSAFRFGPMEWLWRSLSYLRPQPMRSPATAGE